jgi:uncharacterized membrane protein YcaP (DUF421 family)
MFELTVPLWEIVLRTIVVYLTVLLLLRVAGKRELGQMSVIDFVVILVIANAVQNSINGGDDSLVGGLVAAATLVATNVLLDRLGRRLPFVARFFREEPTLLMQDGSLITNNMDREHIERDEIEMAAREHGVADLTGVDMAILEPDGSISIIPRERGRVHRFTAVRPTVPPAKLVASRERRRRGPQIRVRPRDSRRSRADHQRRSSLARQDSVPTRP